MAESTLAFLRRRRWIWPLLGILILWGALTVLTARFSIYSLTGVAVSASFLLLPALGQMLVITTGRGNIDLSIPSTVTLAAYLSVMTANGTDAGFLLSLAIVLSGGIAIGLFNALLVLGLRIPAMIATLASGYILATGVMIVNAQINTFSRPPLLAWVATGRVGELPVMVIVAILVAVVIGFMLARSAYGRQLFAVGQSLEAARLAGVRVKSTIASTFVISAALSSLTGMLLSGYAGGAFLEMGTPYLLQSVGAVVLGGTLIAGGSATAFGTLLGGMLLVMIVTTMQIAGLPPGAQDILQGVVIIAVLSVAGTRIGRQAS
ncbi:ABC transporter permease [Tianweitania sediminis]|uniref:ABC transporter permease n=1 Tax=Tianweitania sediminis TaxID=1502156 RepID=A0A8J7RM56_9HYPH|nr:ABC transporter permease [Tianweitania sediminis]MBP0438279.1 ABC transporter permease [Tianweitania sediminis]